MKPSESILKAAEELTKQGVADTELQGTLGAILAYLDKQSAPFMYTVETASPLGTVVDSTVAPTIFVVLDPATMRVMGTMRWRPNDEAIRRWEAEGLRVEEWRRCVV